VAVYYNDNNRFCAAWLRNLIAAGLIADGEVDERSIEDVKPNDLSGYTQCHFFAGIGVWSAALRAEGLPDDKPIWTGSCPCQPFSAAGKGGGFADERHLWPAFHHLIRECRPPIIFGEQVASKDGLRWLDLVHTDMEAEGYALGAADLCAAGAGAAHIRQRLYWVAYAEPQFNRGGDFGSGRRIEFADGDTTGVVANANAARSQGRGECRDSTNQWPAGASGVDEWIACTDGKLRPTESIIFEVADGVADRLGFMRTGDHFATSPLVEKTFSRVARLQAYGNALHLGTARQFISAII
jgi:DNA (cytosine-5)-methyltransferase 1